MRRAWTKVNSHRAMLSGDLVFVAFCARASAALPAVPAVLAAFALCRSSWSPRRRQFFQASPVRRMGAARDVRAALAAEYLAPCRPSTPRLVVRRGSRATRIAAKTPITRPWTSPREPGARMRHVTCCTWQPAPAAAHCDRRTQVRLALRAPSDGHAGARSSDRPECVRVRGARPPSCPALVRCASVRWRPGPALRLESHRVRRAPGHAMQAKEEKVSSVPDQRDAGWPAWRRPAVRPTPHAP